MKQTTLAPPPQNVKPLWPMLAALTLMLAAAATGFLGEHSKQAHATPKVPASTPLRLVEFELTDRTGRKITRSDLAGCFVVMDFIFTSCSLRCRVVNDRLEEIQRSLAGAEDLRLVSVTVDPRTDTPEVLAKFAAQYHASTNRWFFLTGSKDGVFDFLQHSFLPDPNEPNHIWPFGFADTSRILLIDPQGQVRGSFNGLKASVPTEIIEAIHRLRHR